MTTPVTPQFAVESVLLQRVNIKYNPTWNGVAWVMTPTGIEIEGLGSAGTAGVMVTSANIELTAADLPPAGQAAMQDLYAFIEQAIADQYP
jgi:hypothetical protein